VEYEIKLFSFFGGVLVAAGNIFEIYRHTDSKGDRKGEIQEQNQEPILNSFKI
jgi:hypothetical protein